MSDTYDNVDPTLAGLAIEANPFGGVPHAPTPVENAMGALARGAVNTVATPGSVMQPNPYPQGSEQADYYDALRTKAMTDWAPQMALNTMGTGAIAGVPVKGAEMVAGMAARPRRVPEVVDYRSPQPGDVPPAAPPRAKMGDLAAPSIVQPNLPTADQIGSILSAAKDYGRKGWPTVDKGVFKTTPEAYAETTQLVPQVSIKDRLPGPLPGEKLPNNDRAAPIVASNEAIADRIAERLQPLVNEQSPLLKFYHTGPVIRGLEQHADMTLPQANTFMRDWAGQGAATSPRTQTPPNLRNSSYLMYERARGEPLTPQRYAAEGNRPGFPMMGMHVNLADQFAQGTENALINPKPTTFRENWSGNLPDVTGDTHNIRSTLYQFDQIHPGQLPRGWFTSDAAFAKYKSDGFQAVDAGDIADTLGDKTVKGVRRQSEYLPMTAPWYGAAQRLGIAPAEGQSGGWFSYGGITGLQSPPKTIPNLLNDQIAATAKAAGTTPERIVNWWGRRKIPLAGIAAVPAAGVMGGLAAQDQYQQEQ